MDFGVACIAFLLRHRSTKFNPAQKLGPRYSHYLLSVLRYPGHPFAPNKKSSAPDWEVYRARLASLPRQTDESTAVDFIIYRARLPSLPRPISQSTVVGFLFGAQGREETSALRRNMVRTKRPIAANYSAIPPIIANLLLLFLHLYRVESAYSALNGWGRLEWRIVAPLVLLGRSKLLNSPSFDKGVLKPRSRIRGRY